LHIRPGHTRCCTEKPNLDSRDFFPRQNKLADTILQLAKQLPAAMKIYRYPGVRPFQASDKALFFGRDRDIADLYEMVRAERLA
jgi:hypothetical protein